MWAIESWRLHDTSPYCHALGIGLHLTLSQWLLWTQVSSKSWVLSITSQWDKKSQYSMTNTPSSPKVCSNGSSAASHSFVHSLDPSDHRPVHSVWPHGLRILRKRLPLNSTAFMTEYAWPVYYTLNVVTLTTQDGERTYDEPVHIAEGARSGCVTKEAAEQQILVHTNEVLCPELVRVVDILPNRRNRLLNPKSSAWLVT